MAGRRAGFSRGTRQPGRVFSRTLIRAALIIDVRTAAPVATVTAAAAAAAATADQTRHISPDRASMSAGKQQMPGVAPTSHDDVIGHRGGKGREGRGDKVGCGKRQVLFLLMSSSTKGQ